MRICLIEDNEFVRDSLAFALRSVGCEVTTAESPEAGLAVAGLMRPEVVVTDLNLGRDTGLGVIIELRRRSPDVTLIAMSGGSKDTALHFRLALDAGADHCIEKPFKISDLMRVIELVRERRSQCEVHARDATGDRGTR